MQPSDFLIASGGLLDPAWYPGQQLASTLLPAWILKATSEAGVYAVAFEALVNRVMSEPADQRDRDKSSSFTAEQLRYWQAQARRWRRRADAIDGVGGPGLAVWEGDSVWPPRP